MQTDAPLEKMQFTAMNFTAMHFLGEWARPKFDLDPPYQRGSVWSLERKRNLLRSLRLGVPIGAVVMNHRGFNADVVFGCIDGKQRIETLRGFMDDEFGAPTSWFHPWELGSHIGELVLFSELTQQGQSEFLNYPVPTLECNVVGLAAEAEVFRLINTGGVAQTEETLANAAKVEAG